MFFIGTVNFNKILESKISFIDTIKLQKITIQKPKKTRLKIYSFIFEAKIL